MSAEENKTIVRQYLEAVWNQKDLSVIDTVIAPDLVQHVRNVPVGPQGIRAFFQMIYSAFPDARLTVDDLLAEGDRVMWRFTVRGTHLGPFRGIPATGKAITLTGMALTRMRGGQMVENWNETDDLGLLQQLGVMPAAGR